MSRNRKDGRKGGGHKNTQHKEVWSKRCRDVSMWDKSAPRNGKLSYKDITHRFERRVARQMTRAELAAAGRPSEPQQEN